MNKVKVIVLTNLKDTLILFAGLMAIYGAFCLWALKLGGA